MVLAGIGARLSPAAREFIAEELPPSLAPWLAKGDVALPIDEHILGLATSAGHARELVASVCQVLSETLSNDAVAMLRAEPSIAPLLGEPAPEYSPPHTTRPRGLASTHFGSGHPLDEAHPDRAQSHSVAAENPHGDSKLSSVRR